MARVLALIPLLALVAPAACLKCKSCHGEFGCSVETEVTCSEGESSCRTAVRSAAVCESGGAGRLPPAGTGGADGSWALGERAFLRFQALSKGCARRSRPDEALALSSHLLALAYRAWHCQGDRCNAASLGEPPLGPPGPCPAGPPVPCTPCPRHCQGDRCNAASLGEPPLGPPGPCPAGPPVPCTPCPRHCQGDRCNAASLGEPPLGPPGPCPPAPCPAGPPVPCTPCPRHCQGDRCNAASLGEPPLGPPGPCPAGPPAPCTPCARHCQGDRCNAASLGEPPVGPPGPCPAGPPVPCTPCPRHCQGDRCNAASLGEPPLGPPGPCPAGPPVPCTPCPRHCQGDRCNAASLGEPPLGPPGPCPPAPCPAGPPVPCTPCPRHCQGDRCNAASLGEPPLGPPGPCPAGPPAPCTPCARHCQGDRCNAASLGEPPLGPPGPCPAGPPVPCTPCPRHCQGDRCNAGSLAPCPAGPPVPCTPCPRHCQGDRCNAGSLAPEPATPNQLSCHACTSQGAWCPPSARTQLGCTGAQDQCLDLDITGTLGEFTNMKLKGCTSLPRCQDGLGFYSGTRAIHARCCDTPLCNHLDTDFHVEGESHNGLQCYSCVDEDGVSCTSNSSSTVPCMGHHNMCLEGIGHSRTGGADSGLVTFKGCATPAMCQSSLLALVQELDDAEVYCCTRSLCNTRIMDGRVAEGRPSPPTPTGPVTYLPPSPTLSSTPEPDCILEEGEEEDVVPVAGGHPPLARSHGDQEAETTKSSEGRGLEEGGAFAAVVPTGGPGVTPHPSHVATGGHGTASAEDRDNASSRDNAFGAGGAFSESNAARPTGVPHPDPVARGGPAAVVLEGSSRSEPGTNETPENAREIPAGAGLAHTEEEEEECEEETNYSAWDHVTGEAFVSAGSTESPRLDHNDDSTEASSHIRATTGLSARIFIAERDGHSSANSPSGAGSTTVSPSDGVVAEGAGHGATSSPSLFAAGSSGTGSRTGSARESFVAEGSATSAPDSSAAASGEARSTDSPTPGSPSNRIDAVVHIPYLASRQNESFFSEDKEGGSSQPSATAASPTGPVLATGGARAGSHRGKNKTLCTKHPGVALVDHGLLSQDMPAQAGHAAPPSSPETVSKPEGSLERTEGDRDRPTISFPITLETPNNSLRGPLGNASAPGLDPVEGLVKNTSGWLYTNTPGKPRPPYPSGASGLGSNLGLVTPTLLLVVLLH
ncbi:uncharacterized protein LOC119848076 [Dermochelys coriacea]|uniref:uncharacterized protein LOC119848076 n=1 Tax=Dermochelys coriacea TaxID=27794 RepID=UPI001CA898FC|nr:uncharacterized protein LOC119848076 [Dermochelys coriacea]